MNSQRGDAVNQLKSDYKFCESIIKKHSKSFHYAFSNLNTQDRNAVYAIYAFCRMADDAVDNAETHTEKVQNLDQLSKDLNSFKNKNIPNHPVWRALADVKNKYDISFDMLFKQLDGQKKDIDFKQPETLKDLENYSGYVAGSVGVLLLPIICDGKIDMRVSSALDLGVAMQYTNVLRDIGEDITKLGRIYLPKEWMTDYKITEADLADLTVTPSFIDLWEKLAHEAEKKYDAFLNEIIHYKPEAQLGLLLAVLIYREILDEVRRNKYDCLNKRQAVSVLRKGQIKINAEKMLESMRVGNFFG